MGEFPNRTFEKTTKANLKAISRKGGLANKNNPNAKVAAYFRACKRYGISHRVSAKVVDMLNDEKLSGADWYKHIDMLEKIATETEDPILIEKLTNLKEKWHKAMHGDKHRNENFNVNVNMISDNDIELVMERLLNEDNPNTITDDTKKRKKES